MTITQTLRGSMMFVRFSAMSTDLTISRLFSISLQSLQDTTHYAGSPGDLPEKIYGDCREMFYTQQKPFLCPTNSISTLEVWSVGLIS